VRNGFGLVRIILISCIFVMQQVDVDGCEEEEFIRTASDHATKLVGEAYAEAKTV